MNRKNRRAAAKNVAASASTADLFAEAQRLVQQGAGAPAEALCEQILVREPSNVAALNLAGLIAQSADRHRVAAKFFARAVAAAPRDAACHYSLAVSQRALGERERAAEHFREAIALGLSGMKAGDLIAQSPAVGGCLARLQRKWPAPISDSELFGPPGVAALTDNIFLQCALELVLVSGTLLEAFLTQLRAALLRIAAETPDYKVLDLLCALAQQCFINEYVFAHTGPELREATRLRDAILQGEVRPLSVAAVACYFPLHTLAVAEDLAQREWPEAVARVIKQQVREPFEESRGRDLIPALTPVEDATSRAVQKQYEENPYPRWTVSAPAGGRPAGGGPSEDILIAGCGTGKHSIEIAQLAPNARILALDISRTSLAYAQRKTREAGIANIEYAQADILKLGALGRTFDVIECVGVLHHLADPLAGWRALLPLLRPQGRMCIGLYSEIARRDVVEARAFIALRGFSPTADGIRACRQEIMRGGERLRWASLTNVSDFFSMSGCRDLIFNAMEHRFTLPQIKAFLDAEGLQFLGFEISPRILDAYQRANPGAALEDLDRWHAFEQANPNTFASMYQFWVQKKS